MRLRILFTLRRTGEKKMKDRKKRRTQVVGEVIESKEILNMFVV